MNKDDFEGLNMDTLSKIAWLHKIFSAEFKQEMVGEFEEVVANFKVEPHNIDQVGDMFRHFIFDIMKNYEISRREINSLNKNLVKLLSKIIEEDMLNYDLHREKLPAEWTKVNLLAPLPKIMFYLSYFQISHADRKPFSIYAESNLMMMSKSQIMALKHLLLFMRVIM